MESTYSFYDFLREQVPGYDGNTAIPAADMNLLRKAYIEKLLQEEVGELTEVEKTVASSIGKKKLLAGALGNSEDSPPSFGERLADKVASFGGSWNFIIIFFLIIAGWMLLNFWWFHNRGFDPYPFILLNLILSCLAAIQAPIIMMSQNRQEDKDRERAEHDYKVNLKAEVEIRMLHEKIDHLLLHQNKRLLEIQELQAEMMASISKMIREDRSKP
ncbi:DUF1003 domain-containing protein [Terrimonas ferruginea]|uniref:DUF1003 domain-containing protein n=1 Tax=Terrimonas ferruginea TaxID=249 RepID=UPI000A49939E|nr:DUF1003 domain-containing protein [Terrimonas ferruginea]